MHPYQEASNIQIPLGRAAEDSIPGRELFALLVGVSDWLEMQPCIQGSREGKTVYMLYRNASILLLDYWDYFGRTMARINKNWPLCAYGTADNQETVRLSAVVEEDCVRLMQHTISGQDTEVLNTLCYQVECEDSETADKLILFLKAMDWKKGVEAISWQEADFPREQELLIVPGQRSQFCYAGVSEDGLTKDLLYALDFEQKSALWIAYLKDGFEPVEFEWLADAIDRDSLLNRMEWELALREAMGQLGFQLINRDKDFEVYDAAGKRRYFGAERRRPAEWAFIKILFPLNN